MLLGYKAPFTLKVSSNEISLLEYAAKLDIHEIKCADFKAVKLTEGSLF